ncbi:alpha/beta fold hydrolase [bacterium]|nr:alpha/beta fold hydrolase [bacterium]
MESENTATKKPFYRQPIIPLACSVVVLVALRGWFVARMLGGRYAVESLLFDAVAALFMICVLHLLGNLLTASLTRMVGDKSWAQKAVVKAVRLVALVLVAGTFLLATIQMHPPKIGCTRTPADLGMAFTEHAIQTDDGLTLSAWAIEAYDTTRPVVVVTHGLGANKQNFLSVTEVVHGLGYNIVTFDFRGHGDSAGHTCSFGVKEGLDVKAAYDFAAERFPNRPIYGWSTSMGGAAALRAEAEHDIFDKLVVDATYSSVKNLAMETKFSYLGPLGSSAWHISRLWFGLYVGEDIADFGPEVDIAKIDTPVFLIHGTADSIIPCSESERLRNAAAPGTQLWLVEGAGHSGSINDALYPDRIREFWDSDS